MEKNNALVPEIMMNFMPPALKPLSPNSSLLGLIFQKWSSDRMAQIAENHARVFEANARAFHAQLGMFMSMQTYSSDVQKHFAENKHFEIMWQLEEAKAHAEARSAKANADRDELDLEQFRKAMSEGV